MVFEATEDLAAAIAAPHLTAPCLWSASVDDRVYAQTGASLPVAARFDALFDLDAPQWQGRR